MMICIENQCQIRSYFHIEIQHLRVLFSLPAKMHQSHLLTLNSYKRISCWPFADLLKRNDMNSLFFTGFTYNNLDAAELVYFLFCARTYHQTRKHSSRMRIARFPSSSGGGSAHPPDADPLNPWMQTPLPS